VMTIHLSHPKGDILVFMTGQEDIEATCYCLAERMAKIDGAPLLMVGKHMKNLFPCLSISIYMLVGLAHVFTIARGFTGQDF
jgi:HrpA-like RNA helicase